MDNRQNHFIEGVIIRKLMAINWVKTFSLVWTLAISKTNRLLQLPSFRETFLLLLLYVCSQNHGLVLLLLDFYTISEIVIQDDSGGKIKWHIHFWCPEINLGILETYVSRVQAKTASPGAMFSFPYLATFGFFSVSCSEVHSCTIFPWWW